MIEFVLVFALASGRLYLFSSYLIATLCETILAVDSGTIVPVINGEFI